jgi:hypothetical protein
MHQRATVTMSMRELDRLKVPYPELHQYLGAQVGGGNAECEVRSTAGHRTRQQIAPDLRLQAIIFAHWPPQIRSAPQKTTGQSHWNASRRA